MFALHGSVRLKRDILEILENTTEYLSTKEITDMLGYPSFNSVKQACSELKQQFEQLYTKDEAEFIIKVSGGIKLVRNGVNVQRLAQQLLVNDIVYPLLSILFVHRSILTDSFLEEHFISRTALYNRTRVLNEVLHQYGLHISLSSRITINGEENRIRMFGYIFLFIAHRMMKYFPNSDRQAEFEQMTADIFDYLDIPLTNNQRQMLTLLTFINDTGVYARSRTPDDLLLQHLNVVTYPDKPDFLTDWSTSDWQFYVAFLYIYNLVDAKYNEQLLIKTELLFKEEIDVWLDLFEEYFYSLYPSEKESAQVLLDKHLICAMNFPFEEELLDNFKGVNENTVRAQFPEFMERFEFFWHQLSDQEVIYQKAEYVRRMSLLTAIKLIDFERMKPTINVHVFSDVSELHKNYFQVRLKNNLSNYSLTFVDDYRDAELIISTIEFLEELEENQKLLQVRINFPVLDMLLVEQAARELTSLCPNE